MADLSVFEEAKDSFLKSISAHERSRFSACSSPTQLLEDINKLSILSTDKRRSLKVIKLIDKFNTHIEPYFDVLGIIVSAHPEYAAFAWGSLRLVLQLASNFITFFERLGEMLNTLCGLMPRFAEILDLVKGRYSERLQLSIQQYYVDLFEFFRAVARIFTKPDGKLKRTPFVIGQLMWQPFNTRFENLCKRFEYHKKTVENELDLVHLHETMQLSQLQAAETAQSEKFRRSFAEYQKLLEQSKEEFDREKKESFLGQIQRWLNAPTFRAEFEDAKALREEGTAEWLFGEQKFIDWRNVQMTEGEDSLENILWIKGNPGCGKTILAAAAVEELRNIQDTSQALDTRVCYFFFTEKASPQKVSSMDAYRSFVAQLTQQNRSEDVLIDTCSFAMVHNNEGQRTASANDLFELLKLAAELPNQLYIVLDGMDECSDPDSFPKKLFQIVGQSKVKVLIFSRPNVGFLAKKIPNSKSIRISRESSEEDLRLYFTLRVEELQDDERLPSTPSCELLVARLLQGADGMFLWARLMISYLASDSHVPASRLKIILALEHPEDLDSMFERILNLISSKSRHEQDLARRTFLWLIHAQIQLDEKQLQDVISRSEVDETLLQMIGDVDLSSLSRFTNFEHTIVMACASLVERSTSRGSSTPYYRFIHKAAIDYFTPRDTRDGKDRWFPLSKLSPELRHQFRPTKAVAHAEMTMECLTYLTKRAPASPLSGNMLVKANADNVMASFPFLIYASLLWSSHLADTVSLFDQYPGQMNEMSRDSALTFLSSLSYFLSAKLVLMAWVESFYLFIVKYSNVEALSKITLTTSMVHTRLIQWSQVDNMAFDFKQYRNLPLSVAAFADDLAAMDRLWGDTLMHSPEQIWNDITAFTPSLFFQSTSATSVNSFASMRTSSSSEVPLCKISSDSSEGAIISVLSIWPSKQFEIQWKILSMPGNSDHLDASNALVNLSAGWIAAYDIWNIEEEPRLQHSYKIPLEKNEVALQLQNFLKYKSASYPNHCGLDRWELQFPTSISTDFNVFSILRTIYTLNHGSKIKSTTETWHSFLLPIDQQILGSATSPPGCTQYNWTSAHQPEGSYIYKIQFSEDNHYILHRDTLEPGFYINSSSNPTWTNLTVFEVNLSSVQSCARIIAKTTLMRSNAFFTDCCFHPKLPILALIVFRMTQKTDIMLFGFCLPSSENPYTVVSPSMEKVYHQNFSSCGTSLIVKDRNRFPKVFAITTDRVYQAVLEVSGLEVSEEKDQLSEGSQVSELKRDKSKEIIQRSTFQRSGIIEKLSDDNDGQQLQNITLNHISSSQHQIQLSTLSANTQEDQLLLSLPRWTDVETVKATVSIPASREEKIKIILNKTEKTWYSLSDPVDEHFPALVRKDQRATGAVQKRLL